VRRLSGLLELDRLLRDLRGRLGQQQQQQQQQNLNSTPRPLACVISPHGEEGTGGREGTCARELNSIQTPFRSPPLAFRCLLVLARLVLQLRVWQTLGFTTLKILEILR
jgi:hypothetical protein